MLLLAISVGASAANLKVHCGRTGEDGYSSINAALKKANLQGPNTLTVSGTCNESVVIQSFDRLTLTGQRGASIVDTTNGTGVVLDIVDSHRVSVTGFTISGGLNGVLCEQFSTCYFTANTVQGAADAGVIVAHSNAVFNGDVIQNNAAQGVISLDGSNTVLIGVTLSGNATVGGGAAADARNQSFLQIANSNVHGHGSGSLTSFYHVEHAFVPVIKHKLVDRHYLAPPVFFIFRIQWINADCVKYNARPTRKCGKRFSPIRV